jgi:molybdopterin/thiamine biosynthesis adenylyltransferase
VDGDKLEYSNMNRVRGYVGEDVGEYKAQRLATFIRKMNLGVNVLAINQFLTDSPEAIDAISTCDVVCGCTDDVSGRDILNQCLYYYCQVFIDSGIAGSIGVTLDGSPKLNTQKGRVSCILPEFGSCLRCQNVVNEQKLHKEEFFKTNPHLRKLDPLVLEKDYYIQGAGVQSPGIGPFTSATADNAVATLMNLITPFRDFSEEIRQDNIWIDFIHMNIHSNTPVDNPRCPYCRTRSILLKKETTYRLDTPGYGKLVVN